MMLRTSSMIVMALSFMLLSACVSKKQYQALEAQMADTGRQLGQEELKRRDAEFRLQNAEKSIEKCQKELSFLRQRHAELQNRHSHLSREMESLRLEMETRKSTIRQQKGVITHLDETRRRIEKNLKAEIADHTVRIEELEKKLKVTFIDKILFDTGSVQIKKRGKEVLMEVAKSFGQDAEHKILVEGHTDNVPIGPELMDKFPSNWELSTARAAAVVRLLQNEGGLDPERLSACGYSYYRPLKSNDTQEGRRQNRRIEVILVPVR